MAGMDALKPEIGGCVKGVPADVLFCVSQHGGRVLRGSVLKESFWGALVQPQKSYGIICVSLYWSGSHPDSKEKSMGPTSQ